MIEARIVTLIITPEKTPSPNPNTNHPLPFLPKRALQKDFKTALGPE